MLNMQKEKNLFGACGLAVRSALLCFVMLMSFALGASAQQKAGVFTGTVVDDSGEPLVGVSVTAKNVKGAGVVTDAEGKFTLPAQKDNSVLVFSYIGMKTQEVRAQVGKRLTVRLQDDGHMIDETVVTGIYSRNKESFTGSATTIRQEQLKEIGNLNVLESVAALDPSFMIAENNLMGSDPNTPMSISINGTNSINGLKDTYETQPDQPLFILDGFETTLQRISDLSMDRIESITLLKDAASAAIYGAKAANGVVVVETKKPEAGRLRFTYNGSYQIAWADLRDYDLMNSSEKLQFEKYAGFYGPTDEFGEIVNDSQRRDYYNRYAMTIAGQNTYWMNEPLRNAFTHSHTFGAEGGDSAFRYGMNLVYRKTEGVMKGSDRHNVDGNVHLTYRVKNFNMSNQTTIDYTKADNNVVSFSDFSRMNPFYAKYDEFGDIQKVLYDPESSSESPIYNPMWDMNQSSYNRKDNLQFQNNLMLEFTPIDRLRVQARFSISTTRGKDEVYNSPYATKFEKADDQHKGDFRQTTSTTNRYDGSLIVSWGEVIGKHSYNLIGGAQLSENNSTNAAFSAVGYITDKYSNPNFSNGYPEGGKPTSTINVARSASFYFNGNYSYDQRYLFDVNLRTDGASVFGVNNPFSTTYSFGLGWNAHNEQFFKNLMGESKVLSYLKLAYTYGNPGDQNIDAKMSNSVYTYYNNYTSLFGLATFVSKWGNNDLRYKRMQTHNIGLNLGMFNNRLMLNANYQIRNSDPELMRIDIPTSTGASTVPMNIGATKNKTFTFTANYDVIRKRDLNLKVNGNFIITSMKYDKIGDSLEKLNEEGRTSQSLLRYYDGVSGTAIWAVRSAGIDPARGDEVYIKKDGTYTYKWDSSDEVIVGDMTPDLQGHFGASLRWKNWSVNATFKYSLGGEKQLSTLLNKVESITKQSIKYNQDRRALTDRWKQPGDIAKYKRINDTEATKMSSRFIETENILQLQSFSIGYDTTTAKWLRYVGLTSMNARIYMTDLFRISTIREERGLDYPFQRTISASLGFRF